ncbi:hypothetical protein BASA81_012709 [Batrachochytrium salamandrivorans]|nr:hypothetical protein BASA81_012709 [Batrachochytrium salamandrivorans]
MKRARLLVPLDSLKADTHCGVCLGVLLSCTLGPCCHRLCKDCFETWIRVGDNHVCPACRKPINTKRVLRPDARFDGLIRQMFGDVDEFREQENSLIQTDLRATRLPQATSTTAIGARIPSKPAPKLYCVLSPHRECDWLLLPKKCVWTTADVSMASFRAMLQNESKRPGLKIQLFLKLDEGERETALAEKDTVGELLSRTGDRSCLVLLYKASA